MPADGQPRRPEGARGGRRRRRGGAGGPARAAVARLCLGTGTRGGRLSLEHTPTNADLRRLPAGRVSRPRRETPRRRVAGRSGVSPDLGTPHHRPPEGLSADLRSARRRPVPGVSSELRTPLPERCTACPALGDEREAIRRISYRYPADLAREGGGPILRKSEDRGGSLSPAPAGACSGNMPVGHISRTRAGQWRTTRAWQGFPPDRAERRPLAYAGRHRGRWPQI